MTGELLSRYKIIAEHVAGTTCGLYLARADFDCWRLEHELASKLLNLGGLR
jgi:hypothetical protein